jgi:hypothetical protein
LVPTDSPWRLVAAKVLSHRGYETLLVLLGGFVGIGHFEIACNICADTR